MRIPSTGELNSDEEKIKKKVKQSAASFAIGAGEILYYVSRDTIHKQREIWRVVIPSTRIGDIMKSCHEEVGHHGIKKTLYMIQERYFWWGMY